MIKSLNILLIEDDSIEIMKFDRVLKKLNQSHKVTVALNGEEALTHLNEKGLIPDIIILDLNMPKINGIEFLRLLKSNSKFAMIPSIVLTTSNNHREVKECYTIGIAGYLLKPLKYEDYVTVIKTTLDYWSNNELLAQ